MMTATLIRSNRVFLAVLTIALALVAALVVASVWGGGQSAGAASHAPVVQVTPEDAHWYGVSALVDNVTGDRLIVA